MSGAKYSFGKKNIFDTSKPFKNIQMGIVVSVGKISVNSDTKKNRNQDTRFNADTHAIRCRIIGAKYDNNVLDEDLANCFPVLPKHLNLVPKVDEVVLVVTLGEDEKQSDRFYVGPIISSLTKLNFDSVNTTAMSNFSVGISSPPAEIDKITTANGIYDNPQNVIIEGRSNTDIIQRDNEVLIRSGKFVMDKPLVFNKTNPAYIQLKFNQTITDNNGQPKKISVSNIVANKINLITYDDGSPQFKGITSVNRDTKVAEYINDEVLDDILANAHPLPFGDTLVEYLKLLRRAVAGHVHNGSGNKPTDRTDTGTLPLSEFITKAEKLEKEMLSKNIKIN
tara:strand:- start:41693 stop:42703 length:1011 start_codon:yes stop_codon:yes gene_type:complete